MILKRKADWMNFGLVIFEWFLILFCIYINSQFFSLPLIILSIFFVGTRIHALGILMHEASHFNLNSNRKWNDWITKILITLPALLSLNSYRDSHLTHHKYSQTEMDPTFTRKTGISVFDFPKKNSLVFVCELFSILLFRGAFLAIKDLSRNRRSGAKGSRYELLIGLLLIATIFVFGGGPLFLLFWILPLLTVLPLLNHWRTISEHSSLPDCAEKTRTVIYHPITAWFIAPYNVNYHLEHHLFPGAPWYQLKELHLNLQKSPKRGSADGQVTQGLIPLWKELTNYGL